MYNGEHSITFYKENDENFENGMNTWADWKLIPTSRPIFALPQMKTNFVEVPGASGSLDISETLTGYPTFYNRSGSFEFILSHTGIMDSGYDNTNPSAIYTQIYTILGFLQGQRLKAILDDDPNWYYVGRFVANNIGQEDSHTIIGIDYQVEPYKLSKVANVTELAIEGMRSKIFSGVEIGKMPVCPVFIVANNSDLSITVTNAEMGISETVNVATQTGAVTIDYPQILLTGFNENNQNEIEISGTGSVRVRIRVGGF